MLSRLEMNRGIWSINLHQQTSAPYYSHHTQNLHHSDFLPVHLCANFTPWHTHTPSLLALSIRIPLRLTQIACAQNHISICHMWLPFIFLMLVHMWKGKRLSKIMISPRSQEG